MGFAVAADDVGSMPPAGTLRVIHVDGAAGDGRHGGFVETRLVQRVRVELHLEVDVVGDAECRVDRCRARPVVLVHLDADDAGCDMFEYA